MFKLIKAYWRGFVGGPDFNSGITHRFILGDLFRFSKQLTYAAIALAHFN